MKKGKYFDFFFDIKIPISAVVEKFDFFFRFLTVKLSLVRILLNFFDFRTICVEKTYKVSDFGFGLYYTI